MHIVDQAAKERILKSLADPEALSILTCMRTTSKSAQQISTETGIPLSTIYRKLEDLRVAGLAMTERFTFNAGRKVDFMISSFHEIRVKLESNEVELEVIPSNETASLRWLNLFRDG
jgi:predicted transcriptional regulator